jgi:pyruvate dehydrogenase (quinone)
MSRTAAELIIDRLIDWEVDVVFGLPGDGINGLMEALRTRQDEVRFVQVRHEEAAAFMACAYAKFTGRLGVCIATSGPGAVHLLNGLYDAKKDGAPVLAITGQTYHDLLGTDYHQEVDLLALYRDVTIYNQQLTGAGQTEALVDTACRTALVRRGVAHITCPVDLQQQTIAGDKPSKRRGNGHASPSWTPPVVVPREEDIRKAAAFLNASRKTVILAGQGAFGAADELEALAELMAAPIVKALLGKAVVADDSPYTTGGLGLLGTLPSELAMQHCDALLMVGTSFPYLEYYPRPTRAAAVQIDHDPARIGLRFPIEVGLAGDAAATLRALLPLIDRRTDRSFLEEAQAGMRDWRDRMQARESRLDVPIKPQLVARALSDRLSPNAIVTTDCGTVTTWAARHITIKRGQQFSCSGNLATMACGLPYAIAAQVAYPRRQCVAFVGDGGFTMLMGEFATAVKYRLPLTVVILKNDAFAHIQWEQMVFLGNPEYECELQPIDFAAFASACGGLGFHCEKPEEVGPALDAALRSNRTCLVEVVVDPLEPPMPPRVSFDQTVHMGQALLRGTEHGAQIARTLLRNTLHELGRRSGRAKR